MKISDDENKVYLFFELLIIVMLIIIIVLLIFKNNKEDKETVTDNNSISIVEEKISDNEDSKDNISDSKLPKNIMVDIKGAVKKPGVYSINDNSIVNDVIKAAGGLKSNASTKYINLSKKVSDEMVITIYTNNEVNNMKNPVTDTCISNDYKIDNCENSSIIISDNSNDKVEDKHDKEDNSIKNKVSINTGTKEELMTLSGIGEAKAIAIIEYRNTNGNFKLLEDLMKVSGIGELAYNKIKDNIKL